MKINFKSLYIARYGGGIFAGIKIHFPIAIGDEYPVYPLISEHRNICVEFGLLIFSVTVNIDYAYKHNNTNRTS